MRRFYTIEVEHDLFGGSCLVRQWGRIGTTARTRRDWFSSPGEAQAALGKLAAVKKKRVSVAPLSGCSLSRASHYFEPNTPDKSASTG